MVIIKKCGKKCEVAIFLSAIIILAPLVDIGMKFRELSDIPEISEIIEQDGVATVEDAFFDDWQPSGSHKKRSVWQGYIVPNDTQSAPAASAWWEDDSGEKSKKHSVGAYKPAEPMLTTSVPAITKTEVERMVSGELANAPAMPVAPALVAAKGGIVTTPPKDMGGDREVQSDGIDRMNYPKSSGKFNLDSLPPKSSGTPSWIAGLDSLDGKRTPSGESPEWMRPVMDSLDGKRTPSGERPDWMPA